MRSSSIVPECRRKRASSSCSLVHLFTCLLLGLVFASALTYPAHAQSFGKNKVQYTYFDWEYLTTEHFDIYSSQGGRGIADFAAEVAEEAYGKLAQKFRYPASGFGPITLITYKSHNDFVQTNVTAEHQEEGVGGFTEFLRTRVVVPFEGDHEKFRHVIHHELTHAMMLNLLFGQGFGAIISGVSQARLPLWFTEGLAEYQSRGGLDLETEMFLRDAVVNDNLPEIDDLDHYGYLGVYKCGQSILYFIAWRYGDEKIGEILHQVKGLRDFERALKAAIGLNEEELSKKWRRWLKERYWPQVAGTDPPDRNAHQLTDHRKENCYINNSPALSPDGEYLAFLSDRSDFFDVYLMRTIDGKVLKRLVRGQRTGQFEELHWLRPGITWSPDGKRIALAAKAGKRDAIYLVDVQRSRVVRRFTFESDGIFSPSWSPDGEWIAFVRVLNGQSDIALVEVANGRLELVTDDLFDDDDPAWSQDGERIFFTSNRESDVASAPPSLINRNIRIFEVYEYSRSDSLLQKLTSDSAVARTPLWTSDPDRLLYVSDVSGAFNIYLLDRKTGERHAITNLVTGSFQPTVSRQAGSLAFASYYDNGYDIFLANDPFSPESHLKTAKLPAAEGIRNARLKDADIAGTPTDYSHFVFDRLLKDSDTAFTSTKTPDSTKIAHRSRTEGGKWPSHDYRVQLSPDLVFVSASYSPYFRAQGSGTLLFSDVLGNHQLYLAVDLNRSTENSNFFSMYRYLARRVDLGFGGYHFAYPFDYGRLRDRNFGFFAASSYPFSRFNRAELSAEYMVVERSVWDGEDYRPRSRLTTLAPHLGIVHDTGVWHSSVEPGNGSRWRLDGIWSPKIGSGLGVAFRTGTADWRSYFKIRKDYSLGLRFSAGLSEGENPMRFFLGGVSNWINPRYDNPENGILIDKLNDIYYSSFVGPLRGVGYYNRTGTRYFVNNIEFRFPFIRHLMFGFPLPAYFRDIRGALFTDWGSAWLNGRIKDWNARQRGNSYHDGYLPYKTTFGFGFGIRIDLGIFPLQWDVAWSPHNKGSEMRPQYYFSINTGF
ncbi:MAG: hypothetical protein FJY67_07745 [Calditrichaeota bacterium]|nr:hypothetical protein [Calditrichota bacterium]